MKAFTLALLMLPLTTGCRSPGQEVSFNPWSDSGPDTAVALSARWHPEPSGAGTVLLVHGLGATSEQVDGVAHALQRLGVATLQLDLRGHGRSGGDFPVDNPEAYGVAADDVRGALRWLIDIAGVDTASLALFGISLGGGAVIATALDHPTLPFVAWYPGLTYLARGDSLINHGAPPLRGLILQGTEDRNPRANPGLTCRFLQRQPTVGVAWFEGGGHSPGADRDVYLRTSIDSLMAWLR